MSNSKFLINNGCANTATWSINVLYQQYTTHVAVLAVYSCPGTGTMHKNMTKEATPEQANSTLEILAKRVFETIPCYRAMRVCDCSYSLRQPHSSAQKLYKSDQ